MNHRTLTAKQVAAYTEFLRAEERTDATVEKYSRDIRAFAEWLEERQVTKEAVVRWKEQLLEDSFSPTVVNTKLSAVNGQLRFLGWKECRVKFVRVQKRAFRDAVRDLDRDEYQRLLDAARQAAEIREKTKTEQVFPAPRSGGR